MALICNSVLENLDDDEGNRLAVVNPLAYR